MSESLPAIWSVRRTIPSDTAIAADFVNELVDAMTSREWPPRDVFRVQLAFDEAIVNAIRHGNRFDPEKTVDVEIECNCDAVQIRIADQGEGFDPTTIPDPREDELLEVPGGRGVLLIHELMSSVQYNERGNEINMVKIKGDNPDDDDEDDEEDE
jgi:serine/threonine-protein kinase RsbW